MEDHDNKISLQEEGVDNSDALSLSDLPLYDHRHLEHHKSPPPFNPNNPFNDEHNFFEFSARGSTTPPNRQRIITSSVADQEIIFCGKATPNYYKEEGEEQKPPSDHPFSKTNTNPLEEDHRRSLAFPLSSARLLNQLIYYRSSTSPSNKTSHQKQPPPVVEEAEAGSFSRHQAGGGSVSLKQHKVVTDIKKKQKRRNGSKVPCISTSSAVVADDVGPVVAASGGRRRSDQWGNAGPLWSRARLASAVAKASFGCIRLQRKN